MRRARLHHGLGLEGLPGERFGLRVSRCPAGLQESEQLPEPIFTPSTKAEEGHDETIDFERAAELVGDRGADGARQATPRSTSTPSPPQHARERGVILADTKFEFGLDEDGELVVGDEVLTPDSSRYWPADGYEVGRGQPSFDKQYVRDWAAAQRLGQEAAGARDPRRRRRRHPRALRRGLRAHHRRAVLRWLARTPASNESARADPAKAGILDPQGEAVERALPALGFEGVENVHVGRLVELDVGGARSCEPMCEKLLANPLVEDYEISPDRSAEAALDEVRRPPVPRLLRRGRRAARGARSATRS